MRKRCEYSGWPIFIIIYFKRAISGEESCIIQNITNPEQQTGNVATFYRPFLINSSRTKQIRISPLIITNYYLITYLIVSQTHSTVANVP